MTRDYEDKSGQPRQAKKDQLFRNRFYLGHHALFLSYRISTIRALIWICQSKVGSTGILLERQQECRRVVLLYTEKQGIIANKEEGKIISPFQSRPKITQPP